MSELDDAIKAIADSVAKSEANTKEGIESNTDEDSEETAIKKLTEENLLEELRETELQSRDIDQGTAWNVTYEYQNATGVVYAETEEEAMELAQSGEVDWDTEPEQPFVKLTRDEPMPETPPDDDYSSEDQIRPGEDDDEDEMQYESRE